MNLCPTWNAGFLLKINRAGNRVMTKTEYQPQQNRIKVKKAKYLEGIFMRHWAGLCRYVEYSLPRSNGLEAADIAQSVFSKLAERSELQTIKNEKAFLYRAAHNIAIDAVRHERICERHRQSVLAEEISLVPAEENHTEKLALQRERLRVLSVIIKKMPRKRQRIFVLNRVHGLSYDEIARKEGMKKTAVSRHIFRALEECRAEMDRIFNEGAK